MHPVGETQERPWGTWTIIADSPAVIKLLTVNPGCMLSLQVHRRRSETWQPLSTGLVVYKYNKAYGDNQRVERLLQGSIYIIPRGEVHRLMNPTDTRISVIETITGPYDEDDIQRIHDAYGRD